MGDVTVVGAIWAWRCASGARYGAQAPADRRTDASTMPAARDRADYSPGAGADQTAAQRPIGGIVRVREGCGRQHQSSADHARYGRLLCHSLSTEKLGSEAGRLISLRSTSSSNSPCNKRMARGYGSSRWPRAFCPTRCRSSTTNSATTGRSTRSTCGADPRRENRVEKGVTAGPVRVDAARMTVPWCFPVQPN